MWLLKCRRYALVHVCTQSGALGGMCTHTHTAPEPAHTGCVLSHTMATCWVTLTALSTVTSGQLIVPFCRMFDTTIPIIL